MEGVKSFFNDTFIGFKIMEENEKNETENSQKPKNEEEFKLPQTWDKTLETFLSTPIDNYNGLKAQTFDWTNQTLHNYSNAPTFVAAINGTKKKKIILPPSNKGILQSKEDMVRKMILKPLSPRKPDVIPGSRLIVKQRDRFAVENIIQQRNKRHLLSSLQPLPNLNEEKFPVPGETQRSSSSDLCSVRQFSIPTKERTNRLF